ncbi:hypothetical protein Tco_1142002 [Tanacetum coccineum]
MEKIIEDLDILLSRMDIFVNEMMDTVLDMGELMNIVGFIPENILWIKDIIKRQCMTIEANASNYETDILQIRAIVKENSSKPDIPSCSSDVKMMDLVSEKEETIEVKETYSFRPQSDKTLSFEKIIQNPIIHDPDSKPDEIRYWHEFEAINSIYLTPPDFPEGPEVGSIRRIQGIGYSVLEILGVGTTFDIFQNIIFIPYFQYGVLVFSGYGILIYFPLLSLVSAGTDTPYLP